MDTIQAIAKGLNNKQMLVLIVDNTAYTFKGLKEFRQNKNLWNNKPHIAFTMRGMVSAQYSV